jgi:alkanesulfonate monooxygenase SsuD/methylene tetrahydromethanopterin reductase-like flavin-dependent oxidoreductase (luciferase family)
MTRPFLAPSPYLKLGFFGCNTSGGSGLTRVPERWEGSWDANARLALMAEAAGLDFLIPVARWKGYGGATDYQGSSIDPVAWTAALLALTRRITVFTTVHTAFTHPVLAAKQSASLDAIGHGRFALNVVCGWNAEEYRLFGLELPKEHDERYALGNEWLDIILRIWGSDAPFDWDGRFFQLKGVVGNPKPAGGDLPPLMNAGASPQGRDFAARKSDILFTSPLEPEQAMDELRAHKALAQSHGRVAQVMTGSYVVCRPTRQEALDYHRHYAEEMADGEGVEHLMTALSLNAKSFPPALYDTLKIRFAAGHGGYPLIGSPDDVADAIARIADAGFFGLTLGFVNALDEFPFFRDDVLPRLVARGLRSPSSAEEA